MGAWAVHREGERLTQRQKGKGKNGKAQNMFTRETQRHRGKLVKNLKPKFFSARGLCGSLMSFAMEMQSFERA
jgi:hypothetical protein